MLHWQSLPLGSREDPPPHWPSPVPKELLRHELTCVLMGWKDRTDLPESFINDLLALCKHITSPQGDFLPSVEGLEANAIEEFEDALKAEGQINKKILGSLCYDNEEQVHTEITSENPNSDDLLILENQNEIKKDRRPDLSTVLPDIVDVLDGTFLDGIEYNSDYY